MSLLESFEKMSETAVINEDHLKKFPTNAKKVYKSNDCLAMRQIISNKSFADTNTVSEFADTNWVTTFSDAVMISEKPIFMDNLEVVAY